jgi:nitric oxide synthase oxygenase domain/subunit
MCVTHAHSPLPPPPPPRRNAPKCSNRKFWGELNLLDARDATSPSGMHTACLEILERAAVT